MHDKNIYLRALFWLGACVQQKHQKKISRRQTPRIVWACMRKQIWDLFSVCSHGGEWELLNSFWKRTGIQRSLVWSHTVCMGLFTMQGAVFLIHVEQLLATNRIKLYPHPDHSKGLLKKEGETWGYGNVKVQTVLLQIWVVRNGLNHLITNNLHIRPLGLVNWLIMSEAQGQQTCNSEDKNEHAQMCMSARSAKKKKTE